MVAILPNKPDAKQTKNGISSGKTLYACGTKYKNAAAIKHLRVQYQQ